MKLKFNICNLYFVLIVFGSLSGVFFSTAISKLFQLLVILISLYYTVDVNLKYKMPLYYKGLNILVLMFFVYGFLFMLQGNIYYHRIEVSRTSYLLNISRSLLPIYAFYAFTKQGLLTEKSMKFWFVVFLLSAIVNYYHQQTVTLAKFDELGIDVEGVTNNAGYVFLGLIPAIVVFRKKPIIQYVLLAICGYFILNAAKRGAILTFAICFVVFLVNNYKTAPSKRTKRLMVFGGLLIIGAGIWYVNYIIENNAYFNSRIIETQEGDSSGRDALFASYYEHFINETNQFIIMFGNGANGWLKFAQNYAHNDWLAIAIDQGLLGLMVYLIYWICFYVSWRRMRFRPDAYLSVGLILMIYFLIAFFSMSYLGVSRCAAMALGFYMAIGYNSQQLLDDN